MNTSMEETAENKSVYVIFSTTGTGVGKIIRFFTRYHYNHVAISMDPSMDIMYSFARYNINSPLVGGFVEEFPLRYLYNCENGLEVSVMQVPLTEEQHAIIEQHISDMKEHKEEYLYNVFSAILIPLSKRFPIKKTFTCIDFVTYLMKEAGVIPEERKKQHFSIRMLREELMRYTYFEGNMKELVQIKESYDNPFFERKRPATIVLGTAKHLGALTKRKIS